MAITKLTNTQINAIVNEAYKQYTGKEDIDQIDLSNFSDGGEKEIADKREKFTGALLGVLTKNWFTDSSYRSQYKDVFFEDTAQFGAIVQSISASVPEVQANPAWQDFVSGTSKVGEYTVYLPVVESTYYTKSESWALPLTITGEQWDTAFYNRSGLDEFVAYLFLVLDNALTLHIENMNNMNRNQYIAEKIIYSIGDDPQGVHVIDLLALYAEETALEEGMTVTMAMQNKDFLKFCATTIQTYAEYMQKQSSIFNTKGNVKFVPKDRLVLQMLSSFERKIANNATAETFHKEFLELPLHENVPFWQSIGDTSFEDVSSLHVKTANGEVERSGILALMCDKWAIMHTIRSRRVASQYFNIEDLTHYSYQMRDSYMLNLGLSGVVFVANDFTPQ